MVLYLCHNFVVSINANVVDFLLKCQLMSVLQENDDKYNPCCNLNCHLTHKQTNTIDSVFLTYPQKIHIFYLTLLLFWNLTRQYWDYKNQITNQSNAID